MTRSSCVICGNCNLLTVMDLKRLPLTGIYVQPGHHTPRTEIDNKLQFCELCGHGQLQEVLPPEIVYNDTYTHRSSVSDISIRGNKFFANFIREVSIDRDYKSALDVGCNDGYLLSLLEGLSDERTGIDPTAPEIATFDDGVKIKKGFIENLSPEELKSYDLVMSSHTFEHIPDPVTQLKKLVSSAPENAMFFITVPSLDSMMKNNRWDQVFHQHVNYFSLASLTYMIREAGCIVTNVRYDMNYWLGTQMVSFQKCQSVDPVSHLVPRYESIKDSLEMFELNMIATQKIIHQLKEAGEEIVGYGSAQMLPILNYHCDIFSHIKYIYDDSASRLGLTFPGKSPVILPPPQSLKDKNVIVCALDSSRPVIKRCVELQAKRIICPVQVI